MAKRHKLGGGVAWLNTSLNTYMLMSQDRLIILVPSEKKIANAVHLDSIAEERSVTRKEVMTNIGYNLC